MFVVTPSGVRVLTARDARRHHYEETSTSLVCEARLISHSYELLHRSEALAERHLCYCDYLHRHKRT